ncbi:hypothetical protein Mboo_0120 [Methanoregula boonei 6A8]|jgi:hypothetical protein|uniref:Uncharacterized protein n=1 Tax=Methanoregula boonei (strain DSM 21154 / JCM 14090 / 6A8) TaxID=456442 RepID=A7I4I3_METB6|nr:hypothetical protein [Methanoregula boonei]ABS54644.1 hypothetical protein Mboo_0120 [Methanoregula boonei 6A8]
MADITGDTLVITGGFILVIIIVAITFLRLRTAERRMHESSYKLRTYTDLLNAVTDINLAGNDSYKLDIAKRNLALTLNRLNLIASSGVLKSVSDLLDFLNEHKEKDFDTLRLHNILNTLVIEARRDLNPSHARNIEESKVRYRFFGPVRK